MLIAGDIGGTKTNLALFSAEQGAHDPLVEKRYVSADYASLEEIVLDFVAEVQSPLVEVACFGVPGPVVNGVAHITNLPWVVDSTQLSEKTGIPLIKLMNDLEAMANSIPILEADDVHVLNEGAAEHGGTIAVLAPGTGLGEAFLTFDNGHYTAHPSEGGHARFSPSDEAELGLLNYLMDVYDGHVSTERVCSGLGLPNIYNYLRDSGFAEEPLWFAKRLEERDDIAPIIVNDALNENALPLTKETLRMFASAVGSEAGDLALSFMATGGVYIGGGIPPRILPALKTADFWEAFSEKGRFEDVMQNIPLKVILNGKAPLLGAAHAGFEMLNRRAAANYSTPAA